MNKIFIIIQREYLARVKKRSFLLTTFLIPVLFIGMYVGIILITKKSFEDSHATVYVYDRTETTAKQLEDNKTLTFIRNPEKDLADQLADLTGKKSKTHVLIIPQDFYSAKATELLSGSKPNMALKTALQNNLSDIILKNEYKKLEIDPSLLEGIESKVKLSTKEIAQDGDTKDSYTEVVMGLGVTLSILIYICLMLYGSQVMRGVIEEKTSRIVEIIVSSVKPFQLMMGKIIGVGLVGLTQFALWGVLSLILITAASGIMMQSVDIDPQMIQGSNGMEPAQLSALSEVSGIDLQPILSTIDFPLIFGSFILFFLGGYLLYSALFAAVASAVDSETEVSQFTLPVTMPLLITYLLSFSVLINDPDGAISTWLSMIPFTSPIAMMVRIPFGVDLWQIGLSILLLFSTFILITWLAAKVYKTGILMYGKKASLKEMLKWIKY
ncbi:MAG TPA: ABC transporter permease [Sphingobacterium sp.]|nr:ABC transporter permease [Sphingobacterium sp.]